MNSPKIKYKTFKNSEEFEAFQENKSNVVHTVVLFENGSCSATYFEQKENLSTELQARDIVKKVLTEGGLIKAATELTNLFDKALAIRASRNNLQL